MMEREDMMGYIKLVARVCSDGRVAAAKSYSAPRNADKLEGANQGFLEASATGSPQELAALLNSAHARAIEAHREQGERYWYWRCREAEIEWVANVVSAALYNIGQPMIVPPTARGLMKAADILGVREASDND